jgi:LDH2 family malate/lactate/ureidoglycolate dehydrogenase
MVHEVLTSVLSLGPLFAGDAKGFAPYDRPMNTSFSMLALDITAFQPLATFEARMETMLDTIRSSRLAEEGGVILFPGERAQAEERRRRAEGIPLARATFEQLQGRLGS